VPEPLVLIVDGVRHEGFLRGQVTQTFEASLGASSWSVEYSPRSSEDTDPIVIEAGDPVTLRVGDEDLIVGYVDQTRVSYDAMRRSFQVSGFSRIVDVLDCSAIARARRFRDQTIFEIASQLLDGYEIAIIDRARADEPIAVHAIQEGESIAECLGRAARLRGVVLTDEAGDLSITRVGHATTATMVERGRNVLRGDRTYSWRQRYSEYRFRGQTRATDEMYGIQASQLGQTIEDRAVTRQRRLVVHAHGPRREDIGRRAILERNMRAGRAERLDYEVSGWSNAEGLWRPNTLVRVVDDWLGIDTTALIVRVTHSFATDKWRTQLELTRPEAFSDLDYPLRDRGGRWR
jgi:prophage tail gpP-like protein